MAAYVKCKWLDTAGRRMMPDYNFACKFPLPEMPVLPVSFTNTYGYKPITEAARRMVRKGDCTTCPCFTPASKEQPL